MPSSGRRAKHRRKGAKKFDLTAAREVMKDRRVWCCLGVVAAAQTGGDHFDLDAEGVTVEVELQPSGDQVTALVGTIGGSFGAGIWAIPPVGAEVMILVPDGELDFQPTIVGLTGSGQLPNDVSIDKIVIAAPAGGEVYIHDGTGAVEPVVKKSEYDAFKTAYDSHVHGGVSGGAGSTAPTTSTAPAAAGTAILKAK